MDFDVGYGAAALAGLASFLTPCILPIVPFYLCYISGLSFQDLTSREEAGGSPRSTRVILSAVMFSLGVIIVFVALGAAATSFGQLARAWTVELRWAAAAIIMILGLHYLGVFRIGFLMQEARLDVEGRSLGLIGPVFVGMAFAFGWTPCAGPILAAILFTASDAGSALEGGLLLFAYGLGMTAPFILAACYIGPFLAWAKGIRKYLGAIEKGIGVMLVCFALLIASNSVNQIAAWMLEIAPEMGLLQ